MIGCLELAQTIYDIFGLDLRIELSTRPENRIGDDALWDDGRGGAAAARWRRVGVEYALNEGDGAFYGPKIDLHMTDSIGRSWQMGTIQLDYQMPERFEITYAGEDNAEHRPAMVHRALFGSFERFIGILIEHFAGAFPLWIAPLQVSVLPVADRHNEYAQSVVDELGGGRASAPRRTPARSPSAARSPRPRCSACRASWSSATARPRPAPCRCAAAARATWARGRSPICARRCCWRSRRARCSATRLHGTPGQGQTLLPEQRARSDPRRGSITNRARSPRYTSRACSIGRPPASRVTRVTRIAGAPGRVSQVSASSSSQAVGSIVSWALVGSTP